MREAECRVPDRRWQAPNLKAMDIPESENDQSGGKESLSAEPNRRKLPRSSNELRDWIVLPFRGARTVASLSAIAHSTDRSPRIE